ncbi:hypothetical protein ACMU_16380 [Actibacterium mucosum KCTC 23349]|uniref:HTH lysR-type domain-containing protein n=1 Tax=Actibacterium mucosum KCTC 23349 TaxID=1454373 RepID=A0A037ZGM2_9RHOB|nr:LysR family transcriptional regulator [Actibacterium mucosum]KAJ54691.1 hypothetical protein ACMU_16380 [Actibacterium mucosum KCTC 23349]
MNPTTTQLLHAVAVAECRSFSAAARQCKVAQPTISNSVSDLEELLGKRIFRRSTRKVETTPFGDAILPAIAEAVAAIDRVTVEAQALINPANRLLRVAFTPLLDIGTIDPLFSAYRLKHPDVEIVYKECTHESLAERLTLEQIDVAFAHDMPRHADLRRCPLFADPLHYVPANGLTGDEGATVTVDAFGDTPLLLTNGSCGLAPTTLRLFQQSGTDPHLYAGRAMTHAALKDWAELGLGGAILPSSKLGPDPSRYPRVVVGGAPQRLEYQAVWAKSSEATDHLAMFFRQLPKVSAAIFHQNVA